MANPVKRLAVLGSTGSIGRQTLDVVRALPQRFQIVALAAGKNIDLLARQIGEFKPEFVYYGDQNEKALAHLTGTEYELLSLEGYSITGAVIMPYG